MVHDIVSLPFGERREIWCESITGCVGFGVLIDLDSNARESTPQWVSFPREESMEVSVADDVTGILFDGFGIRIEHSRYIPNTESPALFILFPYLALVLPLTLLAGWLLLRGKKSS